MGSQTTRMSATSYFYVGTLYELYSKFRLDEKSPNFINSYLNYSDGSPQISPVISTIYSVVNLANIVCQRYNENTGGWGNLSGTIKFTFLK